MATPEPPWSLLRTRLPGRESRSWLSFAQPLEVLQAVHPEEVAEVLRRAELAADSGQWAVGFLAYEAAPAFDAAFVTRPPAPLPLAWFALFEDAVEHREPPPAPGPAPELRWRPELEIEAYRTAIDRIRAWIAAGDTYQVNFTFRLESPFAGDPWSLFRNLAGRRPSDHAAFVDTGRHALCSLSPELFFRRRAGSVICRPMKGTAPRGLTAEEDRRRALGLFDSPKDRAENLMIVDMIRNDLGRVAEPGSVRVESLYDLERHDTVYQLTSTVTAESAVSTRHLLAALFPCASVTGAPKVRTMQIIAELERSARGAYTGAIGWLGPNGRAEFNVAIRTVWVDRERQRAEYGTGGGIVWDSAADQEYQECRAKTLVLGSGGREDDFQLLETILWRADGGYHLLDLHLARLAASAAYFGYSLDRPGVVDRLERRETDLRRAGVEGTVLRLLLGRRGGVTLEERTFPADATRAWRLALADQPIDPNDRFLYHKTTRRDVYDRARSAAAAYDDALLWNPVREVTETTRANVAFRHEGVWRTPPVAAGLLAGTERRSLLKAGEVVEERITLDQIATADRIALFNSVRGWIEVSSVANPARGTVLWERNPEAGPS